MPAQVLGVGWRFPVALKDKRIEIARYEDCVRNSIFLILSTGKGERVMRPDFGCGLHELVFSVNGPATQGMAEFHVREALEKWEPRIDLMRVRATGTGGFGEQLLIEIDYRVRLTDNRFNLVYPFYLDRPLT